MISKFISSLVLVLSLIPMTGQAQEVDDYSPWVGREPQDLKTLLTEFDHLCQRRYLSEIEKFKKPFEVAQEWNKNHCQCVGRFLNAKQDPLYVQIVNLKLKDKLQSLPDLPAELSGYLEGFGLMRIECQKNPKYVSPAEKEWRDYLDSMKKTEKTDAKPGMRSSAGSAKPPHGLPTRPQKTPGRD